MIQLYQNLWQKWIEENYFSSGQYSVNNDLKTFKNFNVRFKTLVLRSDFCDYSDQ